MDPKPGDGCPYRKAQEEGGGPHADAGRTCLSLRVPGLTSGHRRLGKGLGPGAPWGPPIGQIWDSWPHDWERMGFCGWKSPARGRAFGHPGHSHRGAGARASVRLRVPSEGSIRRRGLPSLFPQWVAVATWGLGTGGRVGDRASHCVLPGRDAHWTSGKCSRAQRSRLTHRPSDTPSPCPSCGQPSRAGRGPSLGEQLSPGSSQHRVGRTRQWF